MRWRRLLAFGIASACCLAHAAIAQAGDRFYYLGYGVLQVIDGDTDTVVADIRVDGALRELALSADRKFLYAAASRHLLHQIDLETNRVVATVDVSSGGWDRLIFGFAVDPDGRTAYGGFVSRRTERGEAVIGPPVVAQFELATGRLLRSVDVPWGVARLVSIDGGRMLYAFGQDLYKIDTTGSALRIVETVPMFDKGMNILPFWDYTFDNGGIASMNYYTAKYMGLLLVDQENGDIQDIVLEGEPALAYSVVLAPDRRRAYAVMDELVVIDVIAKTYLASVPIREGTSYGVNVSGDRRKIYVAGGGSTVIIYDAATLEPLKVLRMASDGMDLRRIAH